MAKNRKPMHMADWITKLDDFLKLGDHSLLSGAGRISAKRATDKVNAEYDRWHQRAVNAPSAVEQHFADAVGKVKGIETGKSLATLRGKGNRA